MENIEGEIYYDSKEFRKKIKDSISIHSKELQNEINLEKKYINNNIVYA